MARSHVMDKKKLDHYRKKLEDLAQELRRVVQRTEDEGRAADEGQAQDIADIAASSYTKEFLFAQSASERNRLAQVEAALDRIRDGNFGQCLNCGEDINEKRLEAVPWASYCIACQEKHERGELQTA